MYNPYQNISQRTLDIITISCSIMFALFSFLYIYCMQGCLLAEAQFAFSNGITSYSPFWGALMITIILMLIQFLVAKFSRIVGKAYALTYFPSFLLLTVISSVNKNALSDFTFGKWIWIVPLLLIAYCIIVIIVHQLSFRFSSYDDNNHASKYLWPNYLILLVMMLLCGSIHNANDIDMMELSAEEYILDGKYEKAANVGVNSLATSPRLNQLRCYALARTGKLADNMFDYPQYYKGSGLINLQDTFSYERFNSRDICVALGIHCGNSVTTTDRYLDFALNADTLKTRKIVGDYYLCNKLLENNLTAFLQILKVYYNIPDSISVPELPVLYRQALLIEAKNISLDSLNNFCDTITLQTYKDYIALRKKYTNDVECYNYTRREFGNTYFWYRDNYKDFLRTTAERAGM